MKFAIYARKSKFTSSGESINNQITTCKNFIKFKFPDASDGDFQIFQDEDFSGKNTVRPEFQRMLKGIERKHFDFVLTALVEVSMIFLLLLLFLIKKVFNFYLLKNNLILLLLWGKL